MSSAAASFAQLADDLTWFLSCPELRVMHVATRPEDRPLVLEQVRLAEGHARNLSPFFVLEDGHTSLDRGWLVRADRLEVIHDARRKAMSRTGRAPSPLGPRPSCEHELAAFAERLRQVLRSQQGLRELAGLVVVLAPGVLNYRRAFVDSVVELTHAPGLDAVRVIVIELGSKAAPGFTSRLGPLAFISRCESPPVTGMRRSTPFGSSEPPLPGASPEIGAGFAGPRDIVAPTRHGQRPRDSMCAAEIEERVVAFVGADAALIGSAGSDIRRGILAAAGAVQDGRIERAIELQAEARDRCLACGMLRLGTLLEITLATYLLVARCPRESLNVLRAAAQRAWEAQTFDVAAQAQLAHGAVHAAEGEWVPASTSCVRAGESAQRAGASVIAVEAYRLAGEFARRAGATEEAIRLWEMLLAIAKTLEPAVAATSSAPVAARALAGLVDGAALHSVGASLLQDADRLERGEVAVAPTTDRAQDGRPPRPSAGAGSDEP